MTAKIEPLVTVADLDCMPDDGYRYEVIEGVLIMSRSPGLAHQRVSGNLFGSLFVYLSHHPIGEVLATPGVIFSEYDGVIPDLVYMSYERRDEIVTDERISAAPELVIEIISPGSNNERRDRIIKRQLYGAYGVNEYWVVDPQRHTIEVYLLNGQTLALAATLGEADELTSELLPHYRCSVAQIFSF